MYFFADWGYLFLLVLIPLAVLWYFKRGHRTEAAFRYPSLKIIREISGDRHKWKLYVLFGMKVLALVFLILAMARPQRGNTQREFTTEGIDIILVLDISSSMRAVDFQPNRMEAAKSVAREFIDSRRDDRIGLVVFAAQSFLQCPLTIDYDVLTQLLDQVDIIEEKYDGTAIGLAIANAVNRLRDSEAKSKIIILLSDGRNNAGELDPGTAAGMAESFGIKVYTIGAGKEGKAPYPVMYPGGRVQYRLVDVEIDEDVLKNIAAMTGGKYFRATDEQSLATIYHEISEMEKTEIKVKEYLNYQDLYGRFMIPGLFLLMVYLGLSTTIWRKTP